MEVELSENFTKPFLDIKLTNKMPRSLASLLLILMSFVLTGCTKSKTVREVCEQQALDRAVNEVSYKNYPDTNIRAKLQEDLENKHYKDCLILNGEKY